MDERRDQRQPPARRLRLTDCDNDTLLFRVEVEGDGLVCHEGTVSCFTRPIELGKNAEAGNGQ